MKRQTRYWDSVAPKAAFTHPFDKERFCRLVPKAGQVLDLGCGYGRTVQELIDTGYAHVRGLDPSEAMIARGIRQNPEIDLTVWPKGPLPLKAGTVDAVILLAVLTCIPDDSDQKGLVRDIHRVLRPGGILYISDYFLQDDDRNRKRYKNNAVPGRVHGVFQLPGGAVFRHHDKDWIKDLLADFLLIHINEMAVRTLKGNKALAFQKFLQKP